MPEWIQIILEFLALAGTGSGSLRPHGLRNTADGMEEGQWKRVYGCVAMSGIVGYFHRKALELSRQGEIFVPGWFLEKTGHRYRASLYRAMLHRMLYEKLREILDRAGIEYIPLKGIDLMDSLYPDIGWRDLGDLDILVRRGEVGAADRALRECGIDPDDAAARERYWRYHHHFHYAAKLQGHILTVELHWRVPGSNPAYMDYEKLWSEAPLLQDRPESRERKLAPYYLFTTLLLHAANHGSRISMKWLMDIFLLAMKEDLRGDVGKIIRIVDENGCRKRAFFVTSLVRNFFRESPARARYSIFSDLMKRLRLSSWEKSALSRLAEPEVFLERASFLRDKWPYYLFGIIMRDDCASVFRYASRAVLWKLHLEGFRGKARDPFP